MNMHGFSFVVVAALLGSLAGCGRLNHLHFESTGGEGSTTSTGDGGSGGDFLTSGGGGAGGATCDGACVSGKPAWFDGLSLFWIGPPEEAPPCSDIGLSEGSIGYADPLVEPPACPSCACSPAACTLPETMHASAAKCADAEGAISTNFDAPPGWEGTCTAENALSGGGLCAGVPCVQSLTIAAPEIAPCVPQPNGAPNIPPHAWGTVARECVIWPVEAEGCSVGHACVPTPSDRYAVCVYRHGDHTAEAGFACPAEYPRTMVVYASYDDTRSCAACTCGPPEGGQCAAYVSAYKDAECGSILGSITLTSDMSDGCFDLPPGSALGSKEASLLLDQPGSCPAAGGAPTGTFTPSDPMTLCCQPAPEMAP
ncbi:MAG: hypothetical protein U0441_16875 [Polyangiaceae bacterium]